MPDYSTIPTHKLRFLLKKWQDENKRKPTRDNMTRIREIKAALAAKK